VIPVHVRIGNKTWIYEKLLEIKTALNGTWRDVLEYLLTNRANVVLPPIKSGGRTRPIVVLKKIKTLKYIHEFRASTRKPWLDKYLGRTIFSLYAHSKNTSGKLLFIREGEDVIIIDATVATPPLPPSEYTRNVEHLMGAILLRLNKICIEWGCRKITIDADAAPELSYLLEIVKNLRDASQSLRYQ
jgi:hypothetical protein